MIDQRVVEVMDQLPEHLRFPRGLRAWVGFRQEACLYERPARTKGVAKYTWKKLYHLATDGIASMSIRPLKVTQVASFIFMFLAIIFLVLVLLYGKFFESVNISIGMLMLFALVAMGNAVQSFCMYVLGAYVGRTYLEVKGRPSFVVMEVVGSQENESKG